VRLRHVIHGLLEPAPGRSQRQRFKNPRGRAAWPAGPAVGEPHKDVGLVEGHPVVHQVTEGLHRQAAKRRGAVRAASKACQWRGADQWTALPCSHTIQLPKEQTCRLSILEPGYSAHLLFELRDADSLCELHKILDRPVVGPASVVGGPLGEGVVEEREHDLHLVVPHPPQDPTVVSHGLLVKLYRDTARQKQLHHWI
jgi:hypothetical protein